MISAELSHSYSERNWRTYGLAFLAGSSLTLAACGGSATAQRMSAPVTAAASSEAAAPAVPTAEAHGNITFDYLGAKSQVVQVYTGPGTSQADRQPNGTYLDGQKAPADCKIIGRSVTSVPPELHRQSNNWIKIEGPAGAAEYATAVYVQDPAAVLAALPTC
jgi:hypothetical protein